MTPETARKVVVAAAVVGAAAIVFQNGGSFQKSYRRVWGLLLLVAGGAVLADFAPQVVGPYMALVLLGFLLSNKSGLGNLFAQASTAAGTGKTSPGNSLPKGDVSP